MKISDIQVTALHPERWGNDLDVVNAARVSFEKESWWGNFEEEYRTDVFGNIQRDEYFVGVLSEQDTKLIKYLARHKHHSPFNHSFLKFRVKAPIFVARQLVKHKFMPWNEVSRRYVDTEPEFYLPELYRLKADNVKQGSSEETTETFVNPWGGELCQVNAVHSQHIDACLTLYQGMLDNKICAEQARMVLPLSAMTEWYWSGTLGAFLDMLRLRLDPHTQKESRDVAQLIATHVKEAFPVSYHAVLET